MNLQFKLKKENFNRDAIQLLGYALFFSAGTYGVKAIVTGLGMSALETKVSLAVYIVWFVLLFRLMASHMRVLGKVIVWEAVYFAIIYACYKAFPLTQKYYDENNMFLRQIISVFIPCGAIASSIDDYSGCFSYMKKISRFGMVLMIVAYALGYTNRWGNQYLGVQITPFVLILYKNYLETKKLPDILMVIVGVLLTFMGGRQSLVIIVAGILLIYMFAKREQVANMFVFYLILVVLVAVFFMSGDMVASFLKGITEMFGIESRVLDSLISGELFDTSTRDIIYETSFKVIGRNGSKISGLFADRLYLQEKASWIAYSHNLILELLLDFGTVLGTGIAIVIALLTIRSVTVGTDDRRSFGIMICTLSILRLMVSSSFLIEGSFYIMLGLFAGTKEIQKSKTE